MSDLHRAVQAEIAAHMPALQPSFDALKDRKRSRDRRRTTAAAAVSALAVAGIAFVPGAFLGGGGDGRVPGTVAQGRDDTAVFGFHVKAVDAKTAVESGNGWEQALRRCTELPGVSGTSTLYSYPGQYTGRVTGRDNADALTECVAAVPGWGIALTPVAEPEETRTYTVRPSVKTVMNPGLEEERDACFALPGAAAVPVDGSLPTTYRVTVAATGADAFEACIRAVAGLYVPELAPAGDGTDGTDGAEFAWTGVTICRLGGQGPDDCQFFGEKEAAELVAALKTATPASGDEVYCAALTPTYTVRFDHPSVRAVTSTVPLGCGPMQTGQNKYLLPQPARDLVRKVHEEAGTGASVEEFIRRCAAPAGEPPAPVPGFIGRSEGDVVADGADGARVIGRDGVCLDRTDDYAPEREDLLVVRDRIVWAGRG